MKLKTRTEQTPTWSQEYLKSINNSIQHHYVPIVVREPTSKYTMREHPIENYFSLAKFIN